MHKPKQEIITFKADSSMLEALRGIPNRSEFIRSAVLEALHSLCPLCNGTGILTANQQNHWDAFTESHTIQECGDCHELHVTCATLSASDVHSSDRA